MLHLPVDLGAQQMRGYPIHVLPHSVRSDEGQHLQWAIAVILPCLIFVGLSGKLDGSQNSVNLVVFDDFSVELDGSLSQINLKHLVKGASGQHS
jgi:hypothetical protein